MWETVGGTPVFQGRFEHTLDDKGRLALPAPFRKCVTGTDGEGSVMVTISDHCLAAYGLSQWEQKLNKLATLNQFDKHVVAFKRIFVGCAQECALDKAGRILIPQDLRRDACLDKDCIVLGQLEKFEIWSTARWRQLYPEMTDQIGAIAANLAERGFQI